MVSKSKEKLRVLIVEDVEDDALLTVRELRQGGYEPQWQRVETSKDMEIALREHEWDIVLSDHSLPHFSGPEALAILQKAKQDLPFIVISGAVGERVAVKMMKSGVHDFILKGALTRLVPAIRREIGEAKNRRQHKAAEMERQSAIERELHLSAVLRSIREVNQLIVREKRRGPLIESACNILVNTRGFRGTWIVLNDRKADKLLSAQAGFSNDVFRPFIKQFESGDLPLCYRQARLEGGVVSILNPALDCGGCFLCKNAIHHANLGIALLHNGREFGYMCVSVTLEYVNDEEEKSLFAEIAGDIAFALHGIEIENERCEKEAQYRGIFESSKDALLVFDLNGAIKEANPAACEMYGYTREEMIKLSGRDIVHPDSHHMFKKFVDDVNIGELFAAESVDIRVDGSPFPVEVRGSVLDYMGHPHLLAVVRDITERKSAEEALRTERERLSMVIQGSRLGTWIWDTQTNETVFNERWANMLGYTLEELSPCTYETWAKLVHSDDLAQASGRLISCINGDLSEYECEFRMRHKDGHWVWILDRGRVMTYDAQGNPQSMFGTHSDITELKNMQSRLEKSEVHYRLLAENTLDVIWTMNMELTFTYVNPAITFMLGATPEEWIGSRLQDHSTPASFAAMRKIVEQEVGRGPEQHRGLLFEAEMLH